MSRRSELAAAHTGAESFRVLEDPGALDAVEHLYRYLWQRTDPMPPMLDFDWVRTWWKLHAAEGRLFLVQLLRQGRPVALAPLYVRHRRARAREALRTVCFLGTGEPAVQEVYGTNTGWLGPSSTHGELTAAVGAALRHHRRDWDRLWLANLAPTAGLAGRLQKELGGLLASVVATPSCNWVIDVPAGIDDYLAGIPKNRQRKKFRRLLERAVESGVKWQRATTADQAVEMFEQLVMLHTQHWQSRGQPGACSSPVFRAFHRRMIATYARQGRLWLLRFTVGEELLGVRYLLQSGDRLYGYMSGFAAAHRHRSPGNLTTLQLVEIASAEGISSIDLLAGDYGYKHRLATRQLPIATLEAYGRTPSAHAWLALRRLRKRLRSA